MPRYTLHERRGRPAKPESVVTAIRAFERMEDKSLFLATLDDEQRAQIKAIIDRLVAETDGVWTTTEYVQYASIAWFIDRWDQEAKSVPPSELDPRAIDAIMRYRKTLIDAVQTVRSTKGKSDFIGRIKSFALEAVKESGTLKIEYSTKDEPAEAAADANIPVLDVEPIEVVTPKEKKDVGDRNGDAN
jgi:hypothetical protein